MRFSKPDQGARALLCGACVAVLDAVWGACSRKADIFDEPKSTVSPTPTGTPLDAGLTAVDAGFGSPDQVACAERPEDLDCRGANDFLCNLDALVKVVVDECQLASDCTANGWAAVELGEDGCATRFEMSEPNVRFASCVSERFGALSCPCTKTRSQVFLGLGNDGCPDGGPRRCNTGELACRSGEVCVSGLCLPIDAGAAGAAGAPGG